MKAIIVLFSSIFVIEVVSYPDGPPASVCTSLRPGHATPDAANLQNPPPYRITVDSSMYAPGEDITVTIEQTSIENEFRGFIIQARRKSGDMDAPIGTFKDLPADTKLLTCTSEGSTWVHSAATDKTSVTAKWTAPSMDEGTLGFRATIVVQNSGGTSIYYEDIMSDDLMYNGPTQSAEVMTTDSGNTGTQEMTTEDNASEEDDDDSAGMVRASVVLTLMSLLMMALVTRRL